jgi:anaerobic magnesium-protoporphyrin IX monomethyl ester cyclase
MKKLDILFVHPSAKEPRFMIYQELEKNDAAIEPPIWAAMLANHCRSRNFSTEILDCEAERLFVADAANQAVDYNARIICIVVYGQQPSASSQNMEGAIKLADQIKNVGTDSKIVLVGPHISALPKEVLARHSSVDFICQNEGVYTLSNLLLVSDLNDLNTLRNVKGLGFRDGEYIIINEPEMIVPKSLMEQDLPGMAWDLLPDLKKYRTAGWHSWPNKSDKSPFGAIYTSLGCPFRCSFCMINIINRTKLGDHIASSDSNVFRYWEPEFIIKQFDHMAEAGIKNVKIADELFVFNQKHFLNICDLLIERDYGFNIWCYSRIDTCKPQYLEKMKKAGINWIGLGIENPNQVLRKEVHKGGYKDIRILDIINSVKDAGIGVGANYIFGLPMDDEQSIQDTLQFAMENMTEMVNFYTAMAYPGSPLYLEAKSKGWKLPETYAGYSQHSYYTHPLSNGILSSERLLEFRDHAYMKYHSNPAYLDMLEKKYGKEAPDNVRDTLKIELKRKLLE